MCERQPWPVFSNITSLKLSLQEQEAAHELALGGVHSDWEAKHASAVALHRDALATQAAAHEERLRVFSGEQVLAMAQAQSSLSEEHDQLASLAEDKGYTRLGVEFRRLAETYKRDARREAAEERVIE